jgi:hypothetical protein
VTRPGERGQLGRRGMGIPLSTPRPSPDSGDSDRIVEQHAGAVGALETVLGVHADTVREFLGVPAELKLLFGISFGMAAPAARSAARWTSPGPRAGSARSGSPRYPQRSIPRN